MNLLIYSHFFAPSIGGVETIVLRLACGLAERQSVDGSVKFSVTLVTQTAAGDFRDESLPFRVVRQPSSVFLGRLIREADIVHVAGAAIAPLVIAHILRKPVVVEHHGFQHICPTGQLFQEPESVPCPGHFMAGRHSYCLRCSPDPNRIRSVRLWFLTFVRRFLMRRACIHIAPTDWLAQQLQLPNTVTVHHGLMPYPALARAPGANSPPVFAFMGRLVTTKGVRLLLKACQILSTQKQPFKLLIVGDGPERASLEALAREFHLVSQTSFLGRLTQSQITQVLAEVSLVVVPSLGGEVFGMVVAENMLRGIPVLASDLGAFVEVIDDAGLTFKTADSADLAHQMCRLVNDPYMRDSLGASGRRRVLQQFSEERMISDHAMIYQDLAQRKSRRL